MSDHDHLTPAAGPLGSPHAAETTSGNFTASRSSVDSGTHFDLHLHQEDQLAWMSSGSMELAVAGERWHLRREHLVWIPAGQLHAMTFDEPGELISLYADPSLRPPGSPWTAPRTIRADDLPTALMVHLIDSSQPSPHRAQCVSLLTALLADAPAQLDVVALPRDPRAREVATALLEQPADTKELGEWAGDLGVSEKTIGRAFVAETGVTFREWRVNARLHAAAGLLAQGRSVQSVAGEVGYRSVSSFIAAFKARFETTPARYAGARR